MNSILEAIEIEEFIPKELPEKMINKVLDFDEERYLEENPGDPVPSREKRKTHLLYDFYDWNIHWWWAYSKKDNRLAGRGGYWYMNEKSPGYESNKHVVYIDFAVGKDYRRQGVGTAFFRAMLENLKPLGKSLIRVESAAEESGVPMMQRLAGKVVAHRAENRLYLKDVDWELMESWVREGKEKAPDVRTMFFVDAPDDMIEQLANLYTEIYSQVPEGDVPAEYVVSPESRRSDEKNLKERGYHWLTLVSVEKDGTISGMTEILAPKEEPYKAEQELTGVRKEYRGRGLGKWLKAEMILKIRQDFPEMKYLNTGNADNNEHMLAINNRMGFRMHKKQTFFEFDFNEVWERL